MGEVELQSAHWFTPSVIACIKPISATSNIKLTLKSWFCQRFSILKGSNLKIFTFSWPQKWVFEQNHYFVLSFVLLINFTAIVKREGSSEMMKIPFSLSNKQKTERVIFPFFASSTEAFPTKNKTWTCMSGLTCFNLRIYITPDKNRLRYVSRSTLVWIPCFSFLLSRRQ